MDTFIEPKYIQPFHSWFVQNSLSPILLILKAYYYSLDAMQNLIKFSKNVLDYLF